MTEVTNPNDWSVFVCVCRRVGFDSTAPAFVSSAEPARRQGATAGLPPKRSRVPISGDLYMVPVVHLTQNQPLFVLEIAFHEEDQ